MSSADDLILGANYYWILGLPNALDPVADNDELRECIKKMVEEESTNLAGAGSANPVKGARATLILALHNRMNSDLGEEGSNPPTPAETWIRYRREYQSTLKASRAAGQRNANSIFDILGDREISRRLANKVAEELGDEKLFKEIISARNISIRDNSVATDVPPGFETTCDAAKRKVTKLLPYLEAYGAEDVYQLLSLTTGMTLSKASSQEELAAAIDELQQAPSRMTGDTKTKSRPLTEIKTELSNVFKVTARSSKMEPIRTILDDLLRLERAMPFFAAIKLMKSVEILRRDHIERIVVKGAAAGGLAPDRVLMLLKALMKKDGTTIGNWELIGHFRVCVSCGTTNLGTDQTCASCRSNLYAICANCDARFDGTVSNCPTCGTGQAEGEAGRAALALAARAIEIGDITQAGNAIAEATRYVPRSQGFFGLNAKLNDLRTKAESEEARVSALVFQKRFMVAAADALGKTPLGFSTSLRDRLQKTSDKALSEANAKTAEAQIKLDAGNSAEAERIVRAALATAADFTPALSLMERMPPQPPKSLSFNEKGAVVLLSWAPPQTSLDGISYEVVRSECGPLRSPSDGEVIASTPDTSYADRSLTCGITLSYAVFTRRGGIVSREAVRKNNVCILAPAERLEAESDEHTIRLSWRLPKGARDVEIRRLSLPMTASKVASAPVLTHAKTSFIDETASTGTEYRYIVTTCYGNPKGKDQHGPAVSTLALITEPPSPISILTLDRTRGRIHWSLSPRPGEDDEILFLSSGTRVPEQHSVIERCDLKISAIAVIGDQATIPLVKLPFGRLRLLVIRTRSGRTRIGPQLTVEHITPPKDVALTLSNTGAQISWSWPAGCQLARLYVTIDHLPKQEFLIKADTVGKTASEFIPAQPPFKINIQLTALIDKSGPESDPVNREGQLVLKNELRFELIRRRRRGSFLSTRGKETVLLVRLKHAELLPEFEIRFHPEYVPGPNDGDCLEIVPATRTITDYHEVEIGTVLGNRQGFINVVVIDEDIRNRMTIAPKNKNSMVTKGEQ